VRIWNMRDGSARVFAENTHFFESVRFSLNGQYVAAGNNDRMLRVWDVRSGRLVRKWTGHQDDVQSVAFTPDGRGLVSGGCDRVVKCWDQGSLGMVQSGGVPVATKILDCKSDVFAVAVSPDAQWISSGLPYKSIIWDAQSAVPQCALTGHDNFVSSVDFSPAENYLALGSHDGYVTLWRYART